MTTLVSDAATDASADEISPPSRTVGRLGLAAFALLAYVPLLFTDVGKIDADSKVYLYTDPARLLAGAASLWDPKIGMGTIAYQMVGFLFPVGPFYWVTEHLLNIAPWVAQRLWLGTLILGAGLGARYLLRTLGMRGPGIAVGMVAYAFTPYAVQFASHQSVLLPPWAGMPWMIAFVVLALREGGWKYPALLAVTVQLTGAVNASTLLFALLAPALWIPYAVFLLREVDWRRAFSVIWRSGLLVTLTSLWWALALAIESALGRDVLRFTEQPATTSATLYPVEILRGLGYWIFYYRDGNGPVGGAAATFMRNPTVLFVSVLIPALALLAATGIRWSYRAYFVLLTLIGVALGVGSSPIGDSSPLGSAFESFSETTVGFALRNSARAVPLVALGLAVLLAAGVSALHQRLEDHGRPRVGLIVVAAVLVLCLVDAPGIWGRNYYDSSLEFSSIPAYWKDAGNSLDAKSHDTRVLALPGSPFASYTWGTTQDPVEPALMNRPFVTVEQIPWGADATANLLNALDQPLQAGALEPDSVAPIARLMGAGDVLLHLDQNTNRYTLVPADVVWDTFSTKTPAGLGAPETFGKPPVRRRSDPGNVARPPLENPAALAVLPVEQPVNMVRAKSADDPLVVDGDGDGLVGVASVGRLDARRLVMYSATFGKKPEVLRDLPPGAALIVTDSNRRRPYWATSLVKSYGPTEQAGEEPLAKSGYDQRLDVFPDAAGDSQTTTIMRGVKSVRATQGYHVFNLVSTRPSLVLDGSIYTGWSVDGGARTVGKERLRIDLEKPITTDQINLVQPPDDGTQGRWITRVTLRFDGKDEVHRDLLGSSRTPLGQTLSFPKRKFSTVEIQVDGVHHVKGRPYDAVGFQEVRVADDAPYASPVSVRELARMPQDLLKTLGDDSTEHPLTFVVSRDAMDDASMGRQIWLPTERSFSLSGTARAGSRASDTELDHFLGIRDAANGGVTASSIERYGDVTARASSAIDNDLSTAWNTPLGTALGTMEVTVPDDISVDHIHLSLVDDGRHSVPTALEIKSDDGTIRKIDLALLPHTPGADGTVSVPVTFDPISGHRFTISITDFKGTTAKTIDHPEGTFLPSGIAELGIPGVERASMPANLPSRCIDDLVEIDGKPFPVRVTGSTSDALDSRPLTIAPCNGKPLTLSAGNHEITAAESPNSPSGADIQHLVLDSAAGGAAASAGDNTESSDPGPEVRVAGQTRTSMSLEVEPATKPYWLVLGQSLNRGWKAKANGHDLGEPTLVDGYANGWLVQPDESGKATTIALEWAPQKTIRWAFLISGLAFIACLALIAGAFVRNRKRQRLPLANAAPPRLRRVLWPQPLDHRRGAIIGTVLAVTVLGSLLVKLWVGPVVGAFVLLAILYPRVRLALRLAPAVLVTATAGWMTVTQLVRDHPPVFQWPSYFDAARLPVWIALVLLAADALIALVWRTDFDEPVDQNGTVANTT